MSRLYQDIRNSILQYMRMEDEKLDIDLKLFNGTITCSCLITSKNVFYEPYVLGRSPNQEAQHVLGGELPLFHVNNENTDDGNNTSLIKEVLDSNFKILWSSSSISPEKYDDIGLAQETIFNHTIERLRSTNYKD